MKKLVRKLASEQLYNKIVVPKHVAMSVGYNVLHRFPGRGLHIIAVTGTNGKTSTCNFLNDALKACGYSTAMLTTAIVEVDGERTVNRSHRTVPLIGDLINFLMAAKTKKVDWVIMETTSHALYQHKMLALPIAIAVMTNLTQDHLDYHGTMQRYAKAKARLFGRYSNPKYCILNADDEWFQYFFDRSSGNVRTYGRSEQADYRIKAIQSKRGGIALELETDGKSVALHSPVIGEFNGYNLAAVAGICKTIGIADDQLKEAFRQISPVIGRMEQLTSSQGFSIVVDYAHTPDALRKALETLRNDAKGKVRIVFGATGERDPLKRPLMGRVAAELADVIYLTDDETYSEDGATIRRAVMKGIVEGGGEKKTTEIADRYAAIEAAVKNAQAGDIILLAGIGHQDYRAMNEGNIAWQEIDVAREILQRSGRA